MGAFLSIQTWVQNAGVNQQGMQSRPVLSSSDLVSWSVTASSELASGGLTSFWPGADEILLQGYRDQWRPGDTARLPTKLKSDQNPRKWRVFSR